MGVGTTAQNLMENVSLHHGSHDGDEARRLEHTVRTGELRRRGRVAPPARPHAAGGGHHRMLLALESAQRLGECAHVVQRRLKNYIHPSGLELVLA